MYLLLIAAAAFLFSCRAAILKNNIPDLNKENYNTTIQNNELIAVLFYNYDLEIMLHTCEDAKKEIGSAIQFAKVFSKTDSSLADTAKVTSFPTIVLFKEGKSIGSIKGSCLSTASLVKCIKTKTGLIDKKKNARRCGFSCFKS